MTTPSILTTLSEEKIAAQLPLMSRDAIDWLRERIQDLSNPQRMSSGIIKEKNRYTRTNDFRKFLIGGMYFFVYNPKTRDELPYYDRFPLVFPFRKTQDGFYGLNMHYLPYDLRIKLLDQLLIFKTNSRWDETTKIKYSWALIDGVSRIAPAKPCVKQYLSGHVRSQFRQIYSEDWATAMLLPVERFVGASKQQVWADSRRIMRKS